MLHKCAGPKASKNTKGRHAVVVPPVAVVWARPWRMDGTLTGRDRWERRENSGQAWGRQGAGVESVPLSFCADVEKLDKWKGTLKLYHFHLFLSSHLSEGWFCSCWQVATLLSPLKLTEKPDTYPLLAALSWQMVWHPWCNPRQQW